MIKEHSRKPKTKLDEKLKGLPVKKISFELKEDELSCQQCNSRLMVIGEEVVRRELEYIPTKVKVKEYISVHYGYPECKQTDETYIVKKKIGNNTAYNLSRNSSGIKRARASTPE